MTIKKLPPRDLEALSNYLDGQLSAKETTKLKARLQTEPQLQAAFTELHNVHTLLRNAPQVRTPRSFVLTQAMAEKARRPRVSIFQRQLRTISAIASLVLVVLIGGDFIGQFGMGGAADNAMNDYAAAEAMPAMNTEAANDGGEADQMEDSAVDNNMADESATDMDRADDDAEESEPEPMQAAVEESTAPGASDESEMAAPTMTFAATQESADTYSAEDEEDADNQNERTVEGADGEAEDTVEVEKTSTLAATITIQGEPELMKSPPDFRLVLRLGLLAVAIGSGVWAWNLRKQ